MLYDHVEILIDYLDPLQIDRIHDSSLKEFNGREVPLEQTLQFQVRRFTVRRDILHILRGGCGGCCCVSEWRNFDTIRMANVVESNGVGRVAVVFVFFFSLVQFGICKVQVVLIVKSAGVIPQMQMDFVVVVGEGGCFFFVVSVIRNIRKRNEKKQWFSFEIIHNVRHHRERHDERYKTECTFINSYTVSVDTFRPISSQRLLTLHKCLESHSCRHNIFTQ